MIDKEIGEIRRHLRRDRSSITHLYGCYVNFCNEHEFSPCHERSLSKGITEYTGMRLKTYSIAGKSVRHFTD